MSNSLITVGRYPYLHQADAAQLHLEMAGIPAFLLNAHIMNADWLLGNAVGDVQVQVPTHLVHQAIEVLNDFRTEVNAGPGDSGEICLACQAKMNPVQTCCPACGWSYTDVEQERQHPSGLASIEDELDQLTEYRPQSATNMAGFRKVSKSLFKSYIVIILGWPAILIVIFLLRVLFGLDPLW